MVRIFLLLLSIAILAVIAATGYLLVKNVSTPEIQVPDVMGRPYEEAVALLKDRGLMVEIVSVFGPDTEANTVVRLVPPAGSLVKPGRRIIVQVVSGEALIEVPELVGTFFVEAENRLRRAGMVKGVDGFRLGQITSVISDSPPGLIQEQNPAAGIMARAGSSVDIIIAVDRSETMPNLVGKRIGEAIEILRARGYAFQSIEPQRTVSTPPDLVMSQAPAPGARLTPTTVIKAIISEAPPEMPAPNAYPSPEPMGPSSTSYSSASSAPAPPPPAPPTEDPFRPIQQP
jgi:serine/threonine-protein kinase